MNELQLKYGCNPNQKPARVFMEDGTDLPITVLNGKPGYINLLDALNGWQLAYTEFYFTDIYWPDFDREELIKAFEKYNKTERRFGGVKEE